MDQALRVFITYELGGWTPDAEDDYYEVRRRPRAGQAGEVSLRQRRQYGVGFDGFAIHDVGTAARMHVTLVPERAADRDGRHELVLSRDDAAQPRS